MVESTHALVGGSRPKKSPRAAKPPPIDTSNGGIAVYESLDTEYNGVPLDYTYPTPSPTAKYDPENDTVYTYIPTNNKGSLAGSNPSLNGGGRKIEPTVNNSNGIPQRNIYHSIGPDTIQHYEFDSNGVGSGVLGAFAGGGVGDSPHNYHMPGDFDQTEGPAVYEDPTLPKFRVRNYKLLACSHK